MSKTLTNNTVKRLVCKHVTLRVFDWLKDRGISITKHEHKTEETDGEFHLGGEYAMKSGKVYIQIGDGYFCAVGRHGDGFLFMDWDDKMPLEEQLNRAYRFAKTGEFENS